MITWGAPGLQIKAHVLDRRQQFLLQRGGILYLKGAIAILDDAVRGAPPVGLVDQQTVGRQLEQMGIVGLGWGVTGLDLDGDDLIAVVHQIIGFARDAQAA